MFISEINRAYKKAYLERTDDSRLGDEREPDCKNDTGDLYNGKGNPP